MEKEQKECAEVENDRDPVEGNEPNEELELVLFQVPECYVYLIPPRKSAASYRADEWDVNKWTWEGALKVYSKGEECIIKLEDKTTGELYARAFLRDGEPHPVEAVIDSSRYFVLRIEENIDGRLRHAFIGIGFRERTQAYDFQAALHDHMKYLEKKKTAEDMEQHYQNESSVDYSLKEGETIVLKLKNKGSSIGEGVSNLTLEEKVTKKEGILSIKPLPLPPAPPSRSTPMTTTPLGSPSSSKEADDDDWNKANDDEVVPSIENKSLPDEDFGDFQVAT
ncbi:uncharacterized protein At1g03900 [Impatiens glandulifera]|uniref:uncharacterized protein At1g03900 n=1 Tax=Impatiens glandulifera TaxID=253017 RepID=UPI001FB094B2|nr:uncharacterized protein At1g03900 [Impatiens glandulifera]XP_047329085.1 uncharacterized protein At1g03900 [Impatiens glandulifera]